MLIFSVYLAQWGIFSKINKIQPKKRTLRIQNVGEPSPGKPIREIHRGGRTRLSSWQVRFCSDDIVSPLAPTP